MAAGLRRWLLIALVVVGSYTVLGNGGTVGGAICGFGPDFLTAVGMPQLAVVVTAMCARSTNATKNFGGPRRFGGLPEEDSPPTQKPAATDSAPGADRDGTVSLKVTLQRGVTIEAAVETLKELQVVVAMVEELEAGAAARPCKVRLPLLHFSGSLMRLHFRKCARTVAPRRSQYAATATRR